MNQNIILNIIGISIAFTFIPIFVFLRNTLKKAGYIFIFLMLSIVLIQILNLLILNNEYTSAKFVFVFYFPLLYLVYPLMNVYFDSLINLEERLKITYWHFVLPAIVFLSFLLLLVICDNETIKNLIVLTTTYKIKFPFSIGINIWIWAIYLLYYIQLIYFVFHFNKKRLQVRKIPHLSFQSEWIKKIIQFILFYEGLLIIFWLIGSNYFLIDTILSDIIILVLGILGLKHNDILFEFQLQKSIEKNRILNSQRKIKSKISDDKKNEIIAELKKIILEEKLYLNPNIKIKNFAKRLHVPEKDLSIIINDSLGKNFSSFINEYRIKEASRLLLEQKIRINEIAFRVGFYSKSAFNSKFKEFVGSTPSEFRKSNSKSILT